MKKPTLFVDKMGDAPNSPLRKAVKMISFGAEIASELVTSSNVEVDIAVVRSASRALQFIKETEDTIILIFVVMKSEEKAANAMVENYPNRVKALDWEEFGLSLMALISEKTEKEKR